MKLPKPKTIGLVICGLLVIGYGAIALRVATYDNAAPPLSPLPASMDSIAIFGASGTAGDGILKAALANPDISRIQVFTRRSTARIEAGVASGKVEEVIHRDYLNYESIAERIADVEAGLLGDWSEFSRGG